MEHFPRSSVNVMVFPVCSQYRGGVRVFSKINLRPALYFGKYISTVVKTDKKGPNYWLSQWKLKPLLQPLVRSKQPSASWWIQLVQSVRLVQILNILYCVSMLRDDRYIENYSNWVILYNWINTCTSFWCISGQPLTGWCMEIQLVELLRLALDIGDQSSPVGAFLENH